MTINALNRRYAMPVRLHDRETLDSFGNRALAANGETAKHRDHLIRLATTSLRIEDRNEAWLNILRTKTGRPDLERLSPLRTHTIHDDNRLCRYCHRGIPLRQMCELCAHGARVWQRPHFDDIVCVHHHRWLGISRGPQVPATDEQIRAAIRLTRLRRKGRVDARLYLFLVDALGRALPNHSAADKERAVFIEVVALASALTNHALLAALLKNRNEFHAPWSLLKHAVAEALGREADDVSRLVWLYLRPTFAALRWAWVTQTPYEPFFAHDLVAPASVADTYLAAAPRDAVAPRVFQLASFNEYLTVTGDTLETVNETRVEDSRLIDAQPSGRVTVPFLCAEGHHTVVRAMAGSAGLLRHIPKCGVCAGRTVIPGMNDLETLQPKVAAALDEVLSRTTARQLSRASSKECGWKCPFGHRYWATVSNRVLNNLTCPWCRGAVLPGVNDLTTTHPHVAAELEHPEKALLLTSNSETLVWWKCAEGHAYGMRVFTRVQVGCCPECRRIRIALQGLNLTSTHPSVAKYWHQRLNGKKLPDHYTHGSGETVWWTCDHNHEYPMRIERKASGLGCPVCSGRRLVSGVNDLATREPVMVLEFHPWKNGVLEPHEIFPSDKKFAWKCLLAGHVTWQTVQHRRKSGGCTECEQPDRILVKPRAA